MVRTRSREPFVAIRRLLRTVRKVNNPLSRKRYLRSFLAALAATAAVLLGSVAPASAHSSVSGTTPADGDVLATAPAEYVMTFNERVTVPDGFFRIVDSSGNIRPLDNVVLTPKENGTVATVTLPTDLDGWNALGWKALSADGHEIEGTVTFTVGTTTVVDGDANKAAVERLQADPLELWRKAATALRSISYAATLVAVGALGFLWSTRRAARRWRKADGTRGDSTRGDGDQGDLSNGSGSADTDTSAEIGAGFDKADIEKPVYRLVSVAAVIGALSAPIALALNTFLLNGGTLDGIGTAFSIQVGTPVGLAQLIRVSAFFAFCTAALLIVDQATKKFGVAIGAVAAVALVVSYSLSGHATIVKWDTIASVALVVHLGVAALWSGGLVALAAAMRRTRGNPQAAGALAESFSRIATISVIILFPAAIALSVAMFTSPSELYSTAYGIRLLGKFAIVAAVALIGAYNHFVVIPRIRRGSTDSIIRSLRRTTVAEVVGVAAIVAATTLLTGQGAPAAGGSHVAHLGGAVEAEIDPTTADVVEDIRPIIARGIFGDGEVELTVSPGRAATTNTVDIVFFDAVGQPLQLDGPVKVRIFLPGSDLVPIERQAIQGANGWQLRTADFGFAGAWRVQVTAAISALNTPTGEVTVAIRPAS